MQVALRDALSPAFSAHHFPLPEWPAAHCRETEGYLKGKVDPRFWGFGTFQARVAHRGVSTQPRLLCPSLTTSGLQHIGPGGPIFGGRDLRRVRGVVVQPGGFQTPSFMPPCTPLHTPACPPAHACVPPCTRMCCITCSTPYVT